VKEVENTMIKVNNLSKSYGDVHAVKNVSMEIEKGEIVGLLGRNGAGKTTMMKMITGYLEPSEGKVEIGGTDVVENRTEIQKQIGYMPENAPMYPEMLVQEYLLMIADLRKIPENRKVPMVVEAAKSTGLEGYLTRPISTLSKGYRQRVGICQAILHDPDVLILDEPTNGLDPVQIVEIRNLIKELARTTTVILSTHILQEIEAVCDRVLILIDGEMARDASLAEFLTSSYITVSIENRITQDELKGVIERIGHLDNPQKRGADPLNSEYTEWSVEWSGDTPPIPELVAEISKKGWKTSLATANPPSLEKAFNELMYKHGTEKEKEKAA